MAVKTPSKKSSMPSSAAVSKKSTLSGTVKDQSGAGKQRIGDLLRKEGYITAHQLDHALKVQRKSNMRLGRILTKLNYIDAETILNVLSRMHGFPAINISRESPQPDALQIMPYEIAKKYMAFPLRIAANTNTLKVTMAEPTDTSAVEAMQAEVKMKLTVCVSTENDIIGAYRTHYQISDEEYALYKEEEEEVEQRRHHLGAEHPPPAIDFGDEPDRIGLRHLEDVVVREEHGRETDHDILGVVFVNFIKLSIVHDQLNSLFDIVRLAGIIRH